ncbi:MAG: hypothetical protein FJ267_19035 [Planctomycetes bacterium]|nr:hypothetical protein [Planctomycetota bacterium]
MPWISGFIDDGGLDVGEVHNFRVPFEISVGGDGSIKLSVESSKLVPLKLFNCEFARGPAVNDNAKRVNYYRVRQHQVHCRRREASSERVGSHFLAVRKTVKSWQPQ